MYSFPGDIMYKNDIKIAFRTFRNQKVFSLINVMGLAVGMACCIFIGIWVQDELQYDRFHRNAGSIYRIAQTEHRDAGDFSWPLSYSAMAPILKESYPGIEEYVRFSKASDILVECEGIRFIEQKFFYVDPSVFRVFDFKLVRGDPEASLMEPNSIVLTEAMAEKYFGMENPIGKILQINNKNTYRVTGIVKNVPGKSHIHFDFLASFSSLKAEYGPVLDLYWAYKCYTYLLIPNPEDAAELEAQFPNFLLRHKGEAWKSYRDFFLQPLTKIHLYSNLQFELEPNGDIRHVRIFPGIALFVLLIACVNYMNLSTAQYTKRASEVGVRKVMGAHRGHIAAQFIGEAIGYAMIALPAALLLVGIFMPAFNQLAAKSLSMRSVFSSAIIPGLVGLLLFVGLVSGSYPAFILSSLAPVRVFKDLSGAGPSALLLRKVLVILQFTVFIVLTITTWIIRNQVDFVKNERLGFQKEDILVLRIENENARREYEVLKQVLLQSPDIESVAASSGVPGSVSLLSVYLPEGSVGEKTCSIRTLCVDGDFVRTLGIETVEGRPFSPDNPSDLRNAYLVNESAAVFFGWQSAQGRSLEDREFRIHGRVIGTVRDFHYQSKRQKIEPLVIRLLPDHRFAMFVSIKLITRDPDRTLAFIRKAWNTFEPERPLDFFFLNDHLDAMYRKEERLTRIFLSFTSLTIIVACLGLFGLVSFIAQEKTKEIGIRKVLGASSLCIVFLLCKDFIPLIGIANGIAWPVVYFAMHRWLENFAYRTSLTWEIFTVPALIAFGFGWVTLSIQSLKAALANPVQSLRYE
jgi:ABC-type antimicrobial peptide transport system permease subunit